MASSFAEPNLLDLESPDVALEVLLSKLLIAGKTVDLSPMLDELVSLRLFRSYFNNYQ